MRAKIETQRKRSRRKKQFYQSFLTLVSIFSLCFLIYFLHSIYPSMREYSKIRPFIDKLGGAMLDVFADYSGSFSLVFQDLKHSAIAIEERKGVQYPSDKLITLPLLAATLYEIKQERLTLNDKIIIKQEGIQSEKNSLFHNDQISLNDLLEVMIIKNDPIAVDHIIELIGMSQIRKNFKELGLQDTKLNRKILDRTAKREGIHNYTSCRDLSFLMEKAFRRTLIDASSSQLILSLLWRQEEKNPSYFELPKHISFSNKRAPELGVIGETSIFFTKKGEYVLCIITQNPSNYKSARQFVERLTFIIARVMSNR